MTFSQLHYTSCENGLSGYSGFQFCAATAGVPREVMREVEQNTIYELPSTVRETESDSPEIYPVNLIYTYTAGSGVALFARVQFAGLDFSNRSGNYFAHSLITSNPKDLRSFMPVELWEAPFWQSRQGSSAELPPFASPPQTGPVSRQLIANFLAAQAGSLEQVALLITAADQAISAGRQLLLIGSDTESVCRWIAATSYLLEPDLARQMTFSTYSYDPRRCRTHIVGTISAARPLRADIAASYYVFDLAHGVLPDLLPSPSALLLARCGVAVAPDLWHLAKLLGMASEHRLDDAFAVLASAALIRGHRLTADEFGTAIEWLCNWNGETSVNWMSAAAVGALAQPLAQLPARRQEELIRIALRSDGAGVEGDGSLTSRIECALVESALLEVDRGKPPGDGIMLQTQAARKAASDGCSRRLPECAVDTAIDLLAWASAVGAAPTRDVILRIGRNVVLRSLLDNATFPRLIEVAGEWPVLRAGLLEELARFPSGRRHELISGPAGRIFKLKDFVAHEALGIVWIMGMVRHRHLPRTVALSYIVELRAERHYGFLIDDDLLTELWRGVDWTPQEAAELLDLLPPRELAGNSVSSRLIALLRNAPKQGDLTGWMSFVARLAELPDGVIPREHAELAEEFTRLIKLIKRVMIGTSLNGSIDQLIGLYDEGSLYSREFLDFSLPPLLGYHSRLSLALGRCSPALFHSFCRYATEAISSKRMDNVEIAKIFIAMQSMKSWKPRYSVVLDKQVLRPLLAWPRDEINAIGVEADLIARNSSSALDFWYRRARRRHFRIPPI